MPTSVLFMISSMRGGGSEQQTLLLLRHLDRSRFRPHLYLLEQTGELMSRVPDDVTVNSFDRTNQPGGFYFPGRVLGQQIRHLTKVLVQDSIDVIYDRTFHMTMIAGPAGAASGVPRVSTIVSPPELALPLVENRFVWLKRQRLARAYQRSHAVVAVSQQAARSAEQYYELSRNSVQVIRNPVDIQAVRQSVSETVISRGDDVVLVCVGRMTEEKGHRDLISAMILLQSRWPADAPALRLWLVGDGPLRAELESIATKVTGQIAIEFLGTQRCPASFISAADALVLPSHFEGMPNVVLEAMALERPVIASRIGGTVELEQDAPTIWWTEAKAPESIAEAIVEFFRNSREAQRRVSAASVMLNHYHEVHRATRSVEALLSEACRRTS